MVPVAHRSGASAKDRFRPSVDGRQQKPLASREGFLVDMSDIFSKAHFCLMWLTAHLYDANDIDPRDRTYLLSPQDQEAS